MTRLSFRAKLIAIVGSAALAFLVLIFASTITADRVDQQLTTIQDRYVPRVELQPKLETQFEKLRRGFQDAVAAHDSDALEQTRDVLDVLLAELRAASSVVDPTQSEDLRKALIDYHAAAYDVSRRLLAAETGEQLVGAMASMQAKQAHAEQLLKAAASFDRSKLTEAFSAAKQAQTSAAQLRLAVTIGCLAFVLALSLVLSRGTLRALEQLAAGFERFGKGRFGDPIRLPPGDELGDLAGHANRMAASLEVVDGERARTAWLESGRAGLADELRGQLEPEEVARRAVAFVALHLEAPAAVLYWLEAGDLLQALGRYAHSGDGKAHDGAPAFRLGDGLVGQAARGSEITVVTDPPAGYLRVRSGLGESAPKAIVLLPLVHEGNVKGVLELALFKAWTEDAAALLRSVRESIAIAVEVARARSAMRALLSETQTQAGRLTAQEERLRSTNEELQAQQEELRQTNDELTAQATVLEKQRRELMTVSSYKSQFLANMSHELRTPLNSMLLLSQLLGENDANNLTDKQVEYARTIHSAGSDLLNLINQVLDLAKVEAGKQEIRIEQVELRELAAYAERNFGALARRKGLELVVDVAQDCPKALVTDRGRVVQILNNLIGNAIKFTDRGAVTLRIAVSDDSIQFRREELRRKRAVMFTVTDTGVGIAPEHQERVFAPFEQVEASSDRRYGGTGLGLTIARELCALLGGELQLRSARGAGSTFTCCLPFESHAHATLVRGPAATPRPAPAPAPEQADDHLLVIEDDRVFAEVLGDVIRAHGLDHVVATDGRSGLEAARTRRPRGIILDVKLPDVDGFELMEELRADPVLAAVPVHFVSAVEGADRGIALGAIGYLTKPTSREDLARVVEALAPRRADRQCRVLIVEADAATADSLAQLMDRERVGLQRVASAAEALEVLSKERFACIILDLSLPDMDGLDLLESLESLCGADMPGVLVYTGRALSKSEARRLDAYADAVVLKQGASGERLLAEVRLFVRRLRDGTSSTRRSLAPHHPTELRLDGRKIIVADDDMRTVYALSATLRAKGAVVFVADTGRTALTMLDAHPDVDAVLMDIMMPEMDGYEATRRIRENARFRSVPIIALTAKAMKGDREKCLEAGASDYLPKPIDARRLLSMLQALISKEPHVAP
jgi:signal transduction histidine kinase/CheY-like chemotaxis protein/HAMP domain-containing protein